MLDETDTPSESSEDKTTTTTTTRRRAAGRPAGPPAALTTDIFAAPVAPAQNEKVKAEKPKVAKAEVDEAPATDGEAAPTKKTAAKKTSTAKTAAKAAPAKKAAAKKAPPKAAVSTDIFAVPDISAAPPRKRAAKPAVESGDDDFDDDDRPQGRQGNRHQARNDQARDDQDGQSDNGSADDRDDEFDEDGGPRRRRRSRGGRRRRNPPQAGGTPTGDDDDAQDPNDYDSDDNGQDEDGNPSLRRRRRRRAGEDAGVSPDDPENTTVRVREPRNAEDEITGVSGSTRLEAKKQRRREGREAGRRRAPIVSEAEFLARRESVKREMAVRQHSDYTQIAVLEDNVLVEHYVARESQTSLIGNVYLGRVQNVLPSMEAAFVDIGKGRNAVLYAGEVDWTTLGNGKQRKIEDVLSSGQTVLVQVTKDPIGQKGARLTSQISLAGRFLVYVPGGQTSGISRKLPDTERTRLKTLLKEVLPEDAGVIVRTAAEGASEDQLTRDVSALTARWEDIERKVAAGNSPELLYAEPDLMIKVVRDLFNEDFNRLVVEGADAWDMIHGYINHVAPDLIDRLERWTDEAGKDVFTALRVEEQIQKALDRKVFLPSGGSLVIDRTEAMTVVDVNTGKFTGSGGNLEETVTKNNLEAAEEVVRQLRLRDIGGIIVIDFIDMVLESNRDLVLRRLVECLGRDRTRHQVAEVTSLGLVQMTRKRIGTGLLETFGVDCDHCNGRGVVIQSEPIESRSSDDGNQRGGRSRRGGRNQNGNGNSNQASHPKPNDANVSQPKTEPRTETPTEPEPTDVAKAVPPADEPQAEPAVESAVPEIPTVDPEAKQSEDQVVPGAGQPAAPTTEVIVAKDAEKPEITADVTENSSESPATDGPVLTSEDPTP